MKFDIKLKYLIWECFQSSNYRILVICNGNKHIRTHVQPNMYMHMHVQMQMHACMLYIYWIHCLAHATVYFVWLIG